MNQDQVAATTAAYERIAARWAAAWGDARHRADVRRSFAAKLRAGALVVDAGCGPGRDVAGLRDLGLRVVGVDRSPAMLAQARCPLPLVVADLRALPLPSAALDGVWAVASLLHLPKATAPQALGEWRRVLRPGGLLFLEVKEGDGEIWQDEPEDVRRFYAYYRSAELDGLLHAAGFRVVEAATADDSAGRPLRWLRRFAVAGSG